MDIQEKIVNKVAQSGLVTFDPASLYLAGERILYDIKDNLFQGLMLREKDFRGFIKQHNWQEYQDKFVAITCSADAIIPTWAYMLLANKLAPYARKVAFGDLNTLETILFEEAVHNLELEKFQDQRIVIKGCGDVVVPESAYVSLVFRLTPVVKSILYGEPCSTVPVYKRKESV